MRKRAAGAGELNPHSSRVSTAVAPTIRIAITYGIDERAEVVMCALRKCPSVRSITIARTRWARFPNILTFLSRIGLVL